MAVLLFPKTISIFDMRIHERGKIFPGKHPLEVVRIPGGFLYGEAHHFVSIDDPELKSLRVQVFREKFDD